MKSKTLALSLLTLLVSSLPLQAGENANKPVRIVYQCDVPDDKNVDLMINTLNNVVSYYQKNLTDYEIDVVALGPCLQYFMKDFKDTGFVEMPYTQPTQARLKTLVATSGYINLLACQNTMEKKNVKPEQLLDIVKTTPAGVIKVIEDQAKGYSYIKIQ
ncbi:MAG TPA: DsrE family protein [Sulfuricurvum sp.]|nr:MAG: hypothetical protein B7Y30_01200 [Campylobacterales bacterium 16-40-21]OZA03032.1 MAG: hypothetical protein B7X89_06790 [Sulfuricurvum sp. 17-40-25]HQS66883.1 DsrE family protein [Sulfuricurvum sp.]HQT35621.1 DsrE family protein [Sulfuricurvum sp.]